MRNINILYGPPGCGKTTVADLLPPSIDYLSVGRLARKEFDGLTPLGKKMRYYLDSVEEYPEEVIQELIEPPISTAEGYLLLDGFPKYDREVNVLARIMAKNSLSSGGVFSLALDLPEAWDRIKDRIICTKCDHQSTGDGVNCPKCNGPMIKRDDDNFEKFKIRFGDYEQNNDLIKSRLKRMGFEIIKLARGTPHEYRDIITDTLEYARVAQKREQLERFQGVGSSSLSSGSNGQNND